MSQWKTAFTGSIRNELKKRHGGFRSHRGIASYRKKRGKRFTTGFIGELEFGTGGLRGVIGAGENR